MSANITIPVDLTNPGQFFACCGLLELAGRIWPEAEVTGYFLPAVYKISKFQLEGNIALQSQAILREVLTSPREAVESYRTILGSNGKPVADAMKTKPIHIGGRCAIRLSWWLDELAGLVSPFKMWGAHQTSEGLIDNMIQAIDDGAITDATILEFRIGMTGRIGLDTRSSWNTLDEGFSPNDQTLPVDTYPATELLAAIGLETFRPTKTPDGYVYGSWMKPLPVVAARAMASGAPKLPNLHRYRFEIGTRGKFKFLTKSSPI